MYTKPTKTLAEYARDIHNAWDIPHELGRLRFLLVNRQNTMHEYRKILKVQRAQFYIDHKTVEGKAKSDTFVEALWHITEDGADDVWIKEDLTATKALIETLTSHLYMLKQEMKTLPYES